MKGLFLPNTRGIYTQHAGYLYPKVTGIFLVYTLKELLLQAMPKLKKYIIYSYGQWPTINDLPVRNYVFP